MNSQTNIFSIGSVEYEVKKVEAKVERVMVSNVTERTFIIMRGLTHSNQSGMPFYQFIGTEIGLMTQWKSFLISEARKRGFVSGCTIKTALSIDKMKSGRLQLIGLSKLAICGRKQIIIYDNGKWIAEAINNKELITNKMCNYKLSEKEAPYPRANWASECGLQLCVVQGYNGDCNSSEYGKIMPPSGKCMKCKGDIKTDHAVKEKSLECPHCKFISDRFCNNSEKNDREYWLMTEVFAYLHGSDVCNFSNEKQRLSGHYWV